MKLMYFFDNHIKHHMMKGKKYCHPANTGTFGSGLSCIREYDVNMWFYTKGATTIAFDSGHLNFKGLEAEFRKIHIIPTAIQHLFLTHADVDHAGGIDISGKNIFPNARVYLGRDEEPYLTGETHRMKKFGIKLKNCVKIREDYLLLEDGDLIRIEGISVTAIHVPGHTLGHMCYLVDDKILVSGDCMAVNQNGGYSFFDFFTQYPELNKKSLRKLSRIVENKPIEAVCTGHSGIVRNIDNLFSHIDESATSSKKHPFDETAPWDFRK